MSNDFFIPEKAIKLIKESKILLKELTYFYTSKHPQEIKKEEITKKLELLEDD